MRAKVPLVIVCSVVFLGVGVAGGMFLMAAVGYRLTPQGPVPGQALGGKGSDMKAPKDPPGKGGGGKGGGGMGGGGGMMGVMGGGPGGMGGGSGPKSQLTALIAKLDTLTQKP